MFRRLTFISFVVAAVLLTGASCITTKTASGPVGMFRSLDKGETWKQISAMPTPTGVQSIGSLNIFRIYDDPNDVNAMYIGTRGQGLYYTYDNGDAWRVAPALAGKFIYGLVVDPYDKCNVYVSDGPHIYKTEDCTRTWNLVYTEERPAERLVSLTMDFKDRNVLYGAEVGGDILKSEDGGRNWRVIKRFGFNLQYIIADPNVPDRVYVASYRNGLYRTDNGGQNWLELNAGLDTFSGSKNFSRLVLNPAQRDSLFWISKYGILRSDDAGASWKEIPLITPPGSVNIYGFAINPKNQKEIYYTATILGDKNVHVRSTFYITTDGGSSWVTKKLPTNTIPTAIRMHPEENNVLFMGFTDLQQQAATTL
ncbi:hypothetical protein KKA13_03890 [Patescibacteria group bacterium]|nr:hypothetical protein [Patescibacteria group bacterium]MBU1613138.1 hypothetical protein [Patescibacteria group bacterium]